jgi:hypothetical protein
LYEPLRLYVNFLQPSLKLISKKREGSRVIKKYDTAQTPYQRVVADKTIPADLSQASEKQFKRLDPIELLAEIERLQDQLWQYAYVGRRVVAAPVSAKGASQRTLPEQRGPHRGSMELEGPAEAVSSDNEVPFSDNQEASGTTTSTTDASPDRSERLYRRTKRERKQVQGERWWPTRKDPFEEVWEEVEQQLERTPDIHATKLFAWVQEEHPGQFQDGQLRTLQRRVKAWRVEQATCQLESKVDSGTE